MDLKKEWLSVLYMGCSNGVSMPLAKRKDREGANLKFGWISTEAMLINDCWTSAECPEF